MLLPDDARRARPPAARRAPARLALLLRLLVLVLPVLRLLVLRLLVRAAVRFFALAIAIAFVLEGWKVA
ncbi:hypothetical protein [Pseudorhodoplanes sp.]|uniref:hypothetical protein n=1 Tax=Pseudorhodoplanes sp. TaxID=1934341 RepID=UPI002BFA1FB8|nr:hypothetical protein [Pseudorhodoplanes sp.]HWV41430.1 hypothetical protein [Pseudorhodoplanes sp.]